VPADSVLHQAYETVLKTLGLPVEPIIQDVMINGGTHSTEIDVHVGQQLDATTLNLTFSPLRDVQQETLGVAMVLDDVSEKKRLESVRRYLPPELVDKIRDLDAAQRPQRRTLSVLFADMRGFSTYGEEMDPEVLIQIINGYFTVTVQAISRFQGLTDKFMGDAVMALFNTPLNPQEDHVRRALQTALMIQERTAVYRATLPQESHLHFGVGIHTGEAVVGNVGSDLRKDYSAIGDAVTLAKRLQEVAQPDQIIITQDIYEQVKAWAFVEKLEAVQVKGRQAREQLYALKGIQ
jgi:class 3 adenylate cyclase